MGKKSKSDRINALRKQYDAFLEEDKKRKERNDFILCRLEKMRTSTNIVPIRHKDPPQIGEHFLTQEPPQYFGHEKIFRFDDRKIPNSRLTQVSPSCGTQEFTEPLILKEISKKYILIPKHQPVYENNKIYYNPRNESNDSDWRDKYNILDELKKVEKEGELKDKSDQENSNFDHNTFIDNQHSMKENSMDLKQNHNKFPVSNLETNKSNPHALVRKDSDENEELKLELTNKRDIKTNENNNDLNKTKVTILDSTKDQSPINDRKYNDELPQKHVSQIELIDNNQKSKSENNNRYEAVEQSKSQEVHNNCLNNDKNEHLQDESNTYINTVALTNNETIANDSSVIGHIKDQPDETDETVVRCVETIDSKEVVVPHVSSTNDNPILTTTSEENYDPHTTITNNDNTITSQIEDFETEQKEMFYSKEDTYNESNIDTNAQNEQYLNEQYSYYNESQEQPYYTEVNEHEESTERYDPNYQQQYENNYDENTVYGNQQYEVNDTYAHHQELPNVNYNQQSPVNYGYVSSDQANNPEENHMTDENTYDTQLPTNVNYENQENEIHRPYENEQEATSENLDNPDQTAIVNTNNYENPMSQSVNRVSTNLEIEEQQQLENSKVLNMQNTYENIEDDALMEPEVETIQNIEKKLDEEDDYIESKNITEEQPEMLRKIQEPDVKMT